MAAGRRRGSSILEFAIVTSFAIPLLLGSFVVGMNLGRAIQVVQVCRDSGHMYARSVDFSAPSNQDLIVRLAQGMGMTRNGGNGVVVLSTITYISELECAAGGLAPADCPNFEHAVFTHRVVIGNSSLRQSAFGTPNAGLLDSAGHVSNYLTDPSARAENFLSVLPIGSGEFAYVSEAYFAFPDYDIPQYMTGTGVYARSIF